jgi:hypothetical protein
MLVQVLLFALTVKPGWPQQPSDNAQPEWGQVRLDSSDGHLVAEFNWAKQQTLAYVHTGDPVGNWYGSALPGRGFCMRDVSHQCLGAQVLGLAEFNRNMLRRFAASIAESRDWCGFWEIGKDGKPPLIDYRNDQDFWYDLPGNFAVVDACYQVYQWTGDKTYVEDPVFLNFYQRTLNDYIQKWDKDGDGVPESYPQYGDRGLGSFNENPSLHIKVGCDLVSNEYAAYVAYARIQELRGNLVEARRLLAKAEVLRQRFNQNWWNPTWQVYNSMILSDGRMYWESSSTFFPLWNGLIPPGARAAHQLDLVTHLPSPGVMMKEQRDERDTHQSEEDLLPYLPLPGVEETSYLPEIAYRYDRDERAYTILLALADPHQMRREYPEVSFTVIRTAAVGLMGIDPVASSRTVKTLSHLGRETARATLEDIPVFENQITVSHVGLRETTLVNQENQAITWQATFPGRHRRLLLDGKPQTAKVEASLSGRPESYILVEVAASQKRVVRVLNEDK